MHPVLVANAAYRRAIVRLCTEQIREVEGRLEQGCGTRFEQQLQNCEDLGAVARLVLVLRVQWRDGLPELGRRRRRLVLGHIRHPEITAHFA